jgi:hypothetical protein
MALPLIIQRLIAGGLNLVANAALAKGKDWLQEKTGVDLNKANLSNEDYRALQQYEMDHEEELLKIKQEDNRIAAELEMAYLRDIQSARTMQETAIKSEDKFVRRFIYYFAIFWSLCTAGYIGFITFGYIPQENVRFADTILGFLLGTILAGIFNFFYGSSKGSHDKTQALLKEAGK